MYWPDMTACEVWSEKQTQTAQITIPVAERLGQNVVDFEGLSKAFGDKVLIDNLTFKLPPGGIVGFRNRGTCSPQFGQWAA